MRKMLDLTPKQTENHTNLRMRKKKTSLIMTMESENGVGPQEPPAL